MLKAISNGAPDRRALVFLRRGPLVRRAGGWRFGAARITDGVVARLTASGRAAIDGEQLIICQRPEGER